MSERHPQHEDDAELSQILSGREYCPRCGSGPRQAADVEECPDCGRRWDGAPLIGETNA